MRFHTGFCLARLSGFYQLSWWLRDLGSGRRGLGLKPVEAQFNARLTAAFSKASFYLVEICDKDSSRDL